MDESPLELPHDFGCESGELHAINAIVGKSIRECRKTKRMSQTGLGESVGLTFQQVQKYEHGASRITVARLFQFARALDISPIDLLKDAILPNGAFAVTLLQATNRDAGDEILQLINSMSRKTAEMALSIIRLIAVQD